MSFASFLANPKSYLMIHEMALNGAGANLVPAGLTRSAPVANAAHGNSLQFTHVGNVQMAQGHGTLQTNLAASVLRRVHAIGRRAITYIPALGGNFANFRFLPWDGTNITFMQLGGGATFAMTGPLTGCTVAVVRHAAGVWFFHANIAGGGGVNPANIATKRMMVQNAGLIVGIPAGAAYSYCEFNTQYTGLAFVWGHVRGGNWKFYVHEIRPGAQGNAINNLKWATI